MKLFAEYFGAEKSARKNLQSAKNIFSSDLFYKDGNGNLLDNPELLKYFSPSYDENKHEFLSSVLVNPTFFGFEFGSIVSFGESEFYVAPYDYRTESYSSMKKAGGLFERIQNLIENLYSSNGNTPVILFSHSLGCSVTRHFLANYVNQTWKDQYVKVWFAVTGTFGGVPSAFHTLVSCAISILFHPIFQNCSDLERHDFGRYLSGIYFALPSAKTYQSEFVLAHVKKEGTLYTIKNMTDAFTVAFNGTLEAPIRFTLEEEIGTEFDPPNVETRVYYGTGLWTQGSVEYSGEGEEGKEWWEESFATVDVTKGGMDGDSVVPALSQTAPRQWEGTNSKPLHFIELPGFDHGAALFSPRVTSDLALAALGEDPSDEPEEKTKKSISKDLLIIIILGAVTAVVVLGWIVTIVVCVVWKRKQREYTTVPSSDIN